MYKIGEFAKLVDCSVKTLRYYDDIGLLTPDTIDNFTGYRYYSDNNVNEYKLINLLKSVDFSLTEIIEHKDNLNEDILDFKMNEIRERIQLLNHKHRKIDLIKQELRDGKLEFKDDKHSDNKKVLMLRRKYEKRNVGKVA